MRLIDSHCHLDYEGLVERQTEVLQNARQRGVAGFLNISTRQREWDQIVAVAEREPDVWASVGVHPHEADAHPISMPRGKRACRSSCIRAKPKRTPRRSSPRR